MGKDKAIPASRSRIELDRIGKLEGYSTRELLELRERLIADVSSIDEEHRHIAERIKAFNIRKADLAHERAQNAKMLRAVKHELHEREPREVYTAARSSSRRR